MQMGLYLKREFSSTIMEAHREAGSAERVVLTVALDENGSPVSVIADGAMIG